MDSFVSTTEIMPPSIGSAKSRPPARKKKALSPRAVSPRPARPAPRKPLDKPLDKSLDKPLDKPEKDASDPAILRKPSDPAMERDKAAAAAGAAAGAAAVSAEDAQKFKHLGQQLAEQLMEISKLRKEIEDKEKQLSKQVG